MVCCVQLRRGLRVEWLSRDIAVNCRFSNHCKGNGWTFINNWDLFYGKEIMYAMHGVHLFCQGVRVLTEILEEGGELNALKRFFRYSGYS